MLARLEGLDGVRQAEIDLAGEHLRLSLDQGRALAVAIELLASLGYRAEVATDATRADAWYDVRSVAELSLAEAGVIADRVLAPLMARHPLATGRAGTLRAAIVDALQSCFVSTTLGAGPSSGTFRDECVRVSVAAAAQVVGDVVADDLGRLLEADMRQIHRGEPS